MSALSKTTLVITLGALAISGLWLMHVSDSRVEPVHSVQLIHDGTALKTQTDLAAAAQAEDALLNTMQLHGILMVKGSQIEPTARISLADKTSAEFKRGQALAGHWQLQDIREDDVIVANALTHQSDILRLMPEPLLPTGVVATPSSAGKTALLNDARLQFAPQPRSNLNKPDVVDESTWTDMKSKYGL